MIKPTSTSFAAPALRSTQIILDAVHEHQTNTGAMTKQVAADAGVKSNYLSMLKKGSRASLARVSGLKRAMPNLDEHALAATLLTEMFDTKPFTPADTEAAIQTIVDLVLWFNQQPDLDSQLMQVMAEARQDATSRGLVLPDQLSVSTLSSIRALIGADIQRATQAEYAAMHE